MKYNKWKYIKSQLFPCLAFSAITGAATGIVIFLFKIASSYVIEQSQIIYGIARKDPSQLIWLVLGAAAVGLTSALILTLNKNSRGGGIPTSVAILRGLIGFSWVKNLFGLFPSALLTFFGGVPLGTEGPSVQMGTAIGRGTIELFGKKHKGWDRYIMTGGACGGFAVATGAPLTAIIFVFEEVHRRFSPLLFMTAAMTVGTAEAVMHLLSSFTGVSPYLFDIEPAAALPLKYIWVAVMIGIICGISAILFTHLYSGIGELIKKKLAKLPFVLKMLFIFVLVALLGFISSDFIGSGHGLIESLIEGKGVWYLLILCFGIRAVLLMFANNIGVSGGLFVPSLTFGALIGALFSKLVSALGIFPKEYFIIPVIIGMASFLAATSRIPITASAFALEALGGLTNSLSITAGVTLAFLIIEIWGVESFQDTVISEKVKVYNDGKTSSTVDEKVTVMHGSFAQGKEIKNILWPPSCTVLSVQKPEGAGERHGAHLEEGDILRIHYSTYDHAATRTALEAIVGAQPKDEWDITYDADGKQKNTGCIKTS